MHPGGDHHERSSDHGHNDHGEEFLADAVWSLAVKLLDLKHHFLTSIVVFNRPAPKIELYDLLSWKTALVEHVSKKHGDLPIGADKPDHSELDASGLLPLLGAEPLQVVVGGGERNVVLLPAAFDKSLDSGKGGPGRTAEEKVPPLCGALSDKQ